MASGIGGGFASIAVITDEDELRAIAAEEDVGGKAGATAEEAGGELEAAMSGAGGDETESLASTDLLGSSGRFSDSTPSGRALSMLSARERAAEGSPVEVSSGALSRRGASAHTALLAAVDEREEDGSLPVSVIEALERAHAAAARKKLNRKHIEEGLAALRCSPHDLRQSEAERLRLAIEDHLRAAMSPGAVKAGGLPETVAEHDAAFKARESKRAKGLTGIFKALEGVGGGMPPLDATHLVTADVRRGTIGGCHWVADPTEVESPVDEESIVYHGVSGVYFGKVEGADGAGAKYSTFFPTSIPNTDELFAAYGRGKIIAERGPKRIIEMGGVYAQAFSRNQFMTVKSIYPLFHVEEFDPSKGIDVPLRDASGERARSFEKEAIPELLATAVETDTVANTHYFELHDMPGAHRLLVEISAAQGAALIGGVWVKLSLGDLPAAISARIRGAMVPSDPAASGASSRAASGVAASRAAEEEGAAEDDEALGRASALTDRGVSVTPLAFIEEASGRSSRRGRRSRLARTASAASDPFFDEEASGRASRRGGKSRAGTGMSAVDEDGRASRKGRGSRGAVAAELSDEEGTGGRASRRGKKGQRRRK